MYLILNKEKIIKTLSIGICVVVMCCLCVFNKDYDAIQASNMKNKKCVILDPGHGEPDRTVLKV